MTQQTASAYPNTASILALAGGILMILGGVFFLAVSVFILPNLNYSNLQTPPNVTNMPGLISGAVGLVGVFGLASGIIVLASAVMLRTSPSQYKTWGVLILVFSILSFVGLGGFVVGAILGVVGGIMTLTWKPPTQ
jgi:hypothetical protein